MKTVYVYHDELICVRCSFHEGTDHQFDFASDLIEHLKLHMTRGHEVPDKIMNKLLERFYVERQGKS